MLNESARQQPLITLLISSWLIILQQLFRTCFRWSVLLLFLPRDEERPKLYSTVHCLAGNSAIILSTVQPFSVCKGDGRSCEIQRRHAGDIIDDV